MMSTDYVDEGEESAVEDGQLPLYSSYHVQHHHHQHHHDQYHQERRRHFGVDETVDDDDSTSDENESDGSGYGWASPGTPTGTRPAANPQSPPGTEDGCSRNTSPETLPILHPSTSSSSLGSGPTAPTIQQPTSHFPFFVLSIIVVGCLAMFTSQTKLNVANGHVAALVRHKEQVRSMLRKYEAEIRVMDRELTALDSSIQTQHRADTQVALVEAQHQRVALEIGEIKERLKLGSKKATALKELVQSVSQEDVIEKYGPGPQLVELELVFPDFNHRGPTKFIIEMAPAELMPHSVHTFLEMVSAGLLDGCSFILNAMHVVKAAPLPYDGTSAAEKARAFSDKGLESVAFKEYSEDYPHKKHTVGFAADGSPSFYINTEDNSEIHAGDPCFGRVIDGFDAVKRLESNPTRNGIWFVHRVGIKRAQIIK
jgi:cyclophilin family peptidyl-prolyl cis-trans isomerase